jgi:hypothetical protein
MIIGHLAIAGIAKQTYFEKENFLFMSIAVFGPDFIDKPLHLLFRLPVHGVGHSLLFFTAVILIAWFSRTWLKFNSQTSVAGIVMWGTHLVGDFLKPQVLFWPFEGQWIASSKFHNIEGLWEFYVDRLFFAQFWLEIACVMILATLLLSKLFVPLSPPPEIIQVSEVPASDRNL